MRSCSLLLVARREKEGRVVYHLSVYLYISFYPRLKGDSVCLMMETRNRCRAVKVTVPSFLHNGGDEYDFDDERECLDVELVFTLATTRSYRYEE